MLPYRNLKGNGADAIVLISRMSYHILLLRLFLLTLGSRRGGGSWRTCEDGMDGTVLLWLHPSSEGNGDFIDPMWSRKISHHCIHDVFEYIILRATSVRGISLKPHLAHLWTPMSRRGFFAVAAEETDGSAS